MESTILDSSVNLMHMLIIHIDICFVLLAVALRLLNQPCNTQNAIKIETL